MHCVIGSGPSGVACARALLDRGLAVRMVDGGGQLEATRAERVSAMRSRKPSEWSDDELAFLREGTSATAGGVALKRVFGSDFPYQESASLLGLEYAGVGVQASLAQGGLSNVWGAAMLPFTDADLADWPFGTSRLAKHYRAVTALTGMSAIADDLEVQFPLYADQPHTLEASRQAQQILAQLHAHRPALNGAGIRFGASRLAVRGSSRSARGCVQCAQCLYGCPYGFIYSSGATVEALRAHPLFSYQPGFIVESVRETTAHVLVQGRDRRTGEQTAVTCDRVFLAAGAVPSTQIVLRSMEAYNRPIVMLDSQHYMVPLLLRHGTRGVRDESLHTLSQVFLEIFDSAVSPHTVHLQLYTYSDLIGQVVRNAFGPLARALDPLVRSLEGRLVVLQGYLHSAHSASIRMELRRHPERGTDMMHVSSNPRAETAHTIRRVVRKLLRNARHLGALPMTPLMTISDPGRSFHTGGSMPIRETPGELECDVLGRPTGWRRLHVVDATVLPTIPATTITFTVMANAHRIGWESADL